MSKPRRFKSIVFAFILGFFGGVISLCVGTLFVCHHTMKSEVAHCFPKFTSLKDFKKFSQHRAKLLSQRPLQEGVKRIKQIWVNFDDVSSSFRNAFLVVHDPFLSQRSRPSFLGLVLGGLRDASGRHYDSKPSLQGFRRKGVLFRYSTSGVSSISSYLSRLLLGDISGTYRRYRPCRTTIKRAYGGAFFFIMLEETLSKKEILSLAMNRFYFPSRKGKSYLYGVEAASRYYFNKSAARLSLEESIGLAAISYNLYFLSKLEKVKKVMEIVAEEMVRYGYISSKTKSRIDFTKVWAALKNKF